MPGNFLFEALAALIQPAVHEIRLCVVVNVSCSSSVISLRLSDSPMRDIQMIATWVQVNASPLNSAQLPLAIDTPGVRND